ncbi:MAG: beta strand repeat-containing protein, partial [Holosporales bacterium]
MAGQRAEGATLTLGPSCATPVGARHPNHPTLARTCTRSSYGPLKLALSSVLLLSSALPAWATTTITNGNTATQGSNNQFTGTYVVQSGGTLNFNNFTASLAALDAQTGSTLSNNTSLTLNGPGNSTLNSNLGSGSLIISGGTTTIGAAQSYTTTTINSGGTLQVGNGGTTGTLGSGGVTNNGTLTFNRSDALIVANAISGSGAIIKNGAGSLTLSGGNSAYTGTITVNQGDLIQGALNGIRGNLVSASANSTSIDLGNFNTTLLSVNTGINAVLYITGVGTTLTLQGNSAMVVGAGGDGGLTVAGGTTTIGDGTLSSFPLSYAGPTIINSGATLRNTAQFLWGVPNTSSMTLNGTLTLENISSESLNNALSGAGTFIVNTQTNTIDINNSADHSGFTGTYEIQRGILSAGTATNPFGSTARMNLSGGANARLNLNGRSIAIGSLEGTAGSIVNSGTAGAVTLTMGGGNRDTTFAGAIQNGSGTIALTKTGTGLQILTGTNTYTGATTISGGTLQIGNANSSSTLGSGTYASAISIASGATLGFNSSAAQTLSGIISGAGSLSKNGSGTLTLSNASNSYSGGTSLLGGTISIAADNRLGGTSSSLYFDGGTLATTATFTLSGTRALSFGSAGGIFAPASGTTLTVTNNITGSGPLTKADTGTLILSGANTYIGGTTISAGILRTGNDSALNTNQPVTVASGATLDINGATLTLGSLAGGGTVTNTTATSRTLTLGGDNSSTTFSGVLQNGSGTLTLIKNG